MLAWLDFCLDYMDIVDLETYYISKVWRPLDDRADAGERDCDTEDAVCGLRLHGYTTLQHVTNKGIFIILWHWCLSKPREITPYLVQLQSRLLFETPERFPVRITRTDPFSRPTSQPYCPTRRYYLILFFFTALEVLYRHKLERSCEIRGYKNAFDNSGSWLFYPFETSSASDIIPTPALSIPMKTRQNTKAWSVSRRHQQLCGPFSPTSIFSPFACHTETNNLSIK